MNPTIDETSAPIMPSAEELPYHGDNPNGLRRFRLEGGDLARTWRGVDLRPRWSDEGGAWCELSVFPDGTIGSYGGTVWPSAWPDLFTPIPRSADLFIPAQAGTGGFKLTPLGFKLLGMHVTVTPCRPRVLLPNRKRWMVRLDGKMFGHVNEVSPELYDVDLAHAVGLFPSLEKATAMIVAYVERMEQAQQRAELALPSLDVEPLATQPATSVEQQYARLATVAAGRGNHELAADMYMLAAESAVERDVIDGYLQRANVERTAAREAVHSTAVRS